MALQNWRERHDGGGTGASAYRNSRVSIDAPPGTVDLVMEGNRSLSPQRLRTIVLVVGAVLAVSALRAWIMGAWPIAVFLLADAALFVGFTLAFAHRPPPRERLRIEAEDIVLEQYWPGGVRARFPVWQARLDEDEGCDGDFRMRLRVCGRTVQLASMLSAPERRQIAAIVRQGLSR